MTARGSRCRRSPVGVPRSLVLAAVGRSQSEPTILQSKCSARNGSLRCESIAQAHSGREAEAMRIGCWNRADRRILIPSGFSEVELVAPPAGAAVRALELR